MQDDIRDRYRSARRDYTVPPRPKASAESEEPNQTTKKPKNKRSRWLPLMLILPILVAGAGSWWFFKIRNSGPIPKSIQNSAGFAIYYPSPLPLGYKLDKTSVKLSNQVVFFSLKSANSTINLSEQAAPANPPDFSLLEKYNTSFKNLSVLGGQAIYGTSQGLPVAFLLTNTTLINLSGTHQTPLNIIAKVTQNLSPL